MAIKQAADFQKIALICGGIVLFLSTFIIFYKMSRETQDLRSKAAYENPVPTPLRINREKDWKIKR